MKTKTFFTLFAILLYISAFGQQESFTLTFTAVNNDAHLQIDSIKIMNRTQGGDTVLYWPDTVLMLDWLTGIPENKTDMDNFKLYQNYPNPVVNQTSVLLDIPQEGDVNILITNIYGHQILNQSFFLEKGKHDFTFQPGEEIFYFISARWKNITKTIKVVKSPLANHRTPIFKYCGSKGASLILKSGKNPVDFTAFSYNTGNRLLYVAYYNYLQSGITDIPEDGKIYTFQFAKKIPCPDEPTVTYGETTYNTIQIFSQCWLKENLNIGTKIQGDELSSDNSIIEKYCFSNSNQNCQQYGGLYSWWEMMQYTDEEGTQGICPPGWHIPTDEEWKILEGAVDSQFGIGAATWDIWDLRGNDAGMNLKSQTEWNPMGLDLFDFTALPGGVKFGNSNWGGGYGYWWTSTINNNNDGAWQRILKSDDGIERRNEDNSYAMSVRCIKD